MVARHEVEASPRPQSTSFGDCCRGNDYTGYDEFSPAITIVAVIPVVLWAKSRGNQSLLERALRRSVLDKRRAPSSVRLNNTCIQFALMRAVDLRVVALVLDAAYEWCIFGL